MITYAEFQPTSFDPAGLGLPDRQDWLVVGVSHTRDSGPLDESNYDAAVKLFEDIDPDGQHWEEHRFGHWGPGWFEIIIVEPGTCCEDMAEQIECNLDDYPVLDEMDLSRREREGASEAWMWTNMRERVAILAKHGVSIFAARRDEIPRELPHFNDFYDPNY